MKHVAIIMDGNRRWARQNKRKIIAGHRHAAYTSIEPLADACITHDIPYLTLWAFSTENWNRSKEEVEGLLSLFRETLSENIEKLHKKGVRVRSIGDLSKFPQDIQDKVYKGAEKTEKNEKLTLTIALNYGGRDEIVRAIKKSHELRVESYELTEEKFSSLLDTAGMPDPDLIIRTGGEKRLSGFLLWQCAYSELYFTDVLFPDFSPQELEKAIDDFNNRQRRFGT